MKKIGRFLVLIIAVSLLFRIADVSLALAQSDEEPEGFSNVRLWVYPEYDDPRLLVMLEGQIMGVESPAKIRFLVPSEAEMYSAGSMDIQGQYTGGPPDRKPSSISGWDEISYEITTDTFRVEYYDPIIIGQTEKAISYEFRRLYPISELEVVIQEPRSSSDFRAAPSGEPMVDEQGFTSYLYSYSGLDDELPLQFDITYVKSDTSPSLYIEDSDGSSSMLVVVIVLAVGAVAVMGFLWIRKSKPKNRAMRRKLARTTAARGSKGKGRFCTQCGQPAESSSQFCISCGAKLK